MKKRFSFFVCFLVAICLLLPTAGRADFGDFSGNSDYGSWDSGSSWSSSDWGSSSSWSSSDWGSSSSSWSDDDDYGYSGSGPILPIILGNGSSGYSGGYESRDDSGLSMIIGAIIVIIIFTAIIRGIRTNSGISGHTASSASATPAGAQRTPDSKLTPMSKFKELDPKYDDIAFREKLSNLYIRMQNGWTDKDISELQPYFTDALYKQYARQLQNLVKARQTNYVERIAVLDVITRGFFTENNEDHIIAEVRTRIVDYTLDDGTGKLIRGDRTKEKYMTYEYELTRASGIKTGSENGVTRVTCPACGAPLDINTTTHCPYCDSIVTLEEHGWAIAAIKGIAQHTAS